MAVALTDEDLQTLAISECNVDADAGLADKVAANVPIWWAFYIAKGQEIAYWYLRRAICSYILSQYRKKRDLKLGADSFKNSDLINNILHMIAQAQLEIDALDPSTGGLVSSFIPVSGEEYLEVGNCFSGYEGYF